MTIDNLKEKYIKLTKICAETDYAEKKSVRKHNSAVNEMYRIVRSIAENNDEIEINNFTELLNVTENRTNVWVAPQILTELNVDKQTEQKALEIIKKVADGGSDNAEAMGFKMWLKDYKAKN